jgi:5-oxopent-3-ene-1,2,5-tricarboxylate decarboxylase / 2-hydroxyhepta-2,4-diene-1,7-dioate isomerase
MTKPAWSQDAPTLARLRAVSTATLSTQLFARGLKTRFMQDVAPLRPGTRMVGSARTLRYIPMREDLDVLASLGARSNAQRRVIESIEPGEVLVIDGMRQRGAGSLGSILALRLRQRGAAGIVTDGAYRDTPGVAEVGIPAYAAGMNANTNLTIYHPADFDLPIGCGGVMVEPGDAVVGDDEGVIVVPGHLAIEVAAAAAEQELRESYIYELVEGGASVFDVYPMNPEAEAGYRAWRARRGEGAPDA